MKTPIVFAINESYYKQLETVIVSILENSQSNFEFIVLSKGLPEFCKDAIGKTISLYGDRASPTPLNARRVILDFSCSALKGPGIFRYPIDL